MTGTSESRTIGPGLIMHAVRRHLRLITLATLLTGALAAGAALLLPTSYTSSAVVLVNPLNGNPFTASDRLTTLETEAQLVTSDAVAAQAERLLRTGKPPGDLLASVQASVTENTQIIRISYSATSPDVARLRAQAFADGYLAYRRQRAESILESANQRLKVVEKSAREDLAAANQELQRARPGSPQFANATLQVRNYTAQLSSVQGRLAENAAQALDPGEVTSPASSPGARRWLLVAAAVAGGLLLGVSLGLVLALARERRDDRLRSATDIDAAGEIVLSDLPVGAATGALDGEQLPEEYRRLRTALLTVLPELPATVLIGHADDVTSAPVVVSPLAVALARSGVSVAVVDAAVGDWLGVGLGPSSVQGLSEVLTSGAALSDVLTRPATHLAVLPRGRWSPTASERLGSREMRAVVEELRAEFDLVLIAAPSLQSADGQTLMRLADGAVLEATALRTTRADLVDARRSLGRAHIPSLGVVLVHLGPSRRGLRGRKEQSALPAAAVAQLPAGLLTPAPPPRGATGSEQDGNGVTTGGTGAGATRPVVTGPRTTGDAPTDGRGAGQNGAGQNGAGQNGAGQSSAGQSGVGRDGSDQNGSERTGSGPGAGAPLSDRPAAGRPALSGAIRADVEGALGSLLPMTAQPHPSPRPAEPARPGPARAPSGSAATPSDASAPAPSVNGGAPRPTADLTGTSDGTSARSGPPLRRTESFPVPEPFPVPERFAVPDRFAVPEAFNAPEGPSAGHAPGNGRPAAPPPPAPATPAAGQGSGAAQTRPAQTRPAPALTPRTAAAADPVTPTQAASAPAPPRAFTPSPSVERSRPVQEADEGDAEPDGPRDGEPAERLPLPYRVKGGPGSAPPGQATGSGTRPANGTPSGARGWFEGPPRPASEDDSPDAAPRSGPERASRP